jgi:phosphoglycolate phosphatase-like HAD superfamily hydrolase
MQIIKAVLFEPVGCLAEFPAKEFAEIAGALFDSKERASKSGSDAYWRLVDLIQKSGKTLNSSDAKIAEDLEVQAVNSAHLYEDVGPALSELKAMGIELLIASSLSSTAVGHFVERFSLTGFFSRVWTRDTAAGVKVVPLARAIESTPFKPEQVMSLADTTDGLNVAKEVGANSILMINDYDDGRRLAMQAPAGGIISLHELPDAIRLVAASAKTLRP